jgi:cell division septation protein DedD
VGPVKPGSAASAPGPGSFMIQVAATGTRADGDKLVKALKSLNYPAYLLTPEQAHATDSLFRIQVGPYPTRESAEKEKLRLMQDGFKQPFIKH